MSKDNHAVSRWRIAANALTHRFDRRVIFSDLSFEIASGESLAITGPNGSGKSTLIRVISHLIRPTSGALTYYCDGRALTPHSHYASLGLVGPYLQLYNQLSAAENATFFCRIRGIPFDAARFNDLMAGMGLAGREHDELRSYSSGMQQRAKYVCALLHDPEILLLDEPTSNLDDRGSERIFQVMEAQRKGKILIIATNNQTEVQFGDRQIALGT